MVYAFLEGRLGNNLWQIGAAATLAAQWHDSFAAVVSDTHRIEKRLQTKDIQYIIVSDDVAWCKRHFRAENMYVVDNNEPLYDLYINALCNHNILSNITFGLWGGY